MSDAPLWTCFPSLIQWCNHFFGTKDVALYITFIWTNFFCTHIFSNPTGVRCNVAFSYKLMSSMLYCWLFVFTFSVFLFIVLLSCLIVRWSFCQLSFVCTFAKTRTQNITLSHCCITLKSHCTVCFPPVCPFYRHLQSSVPLCRLWWRRRRLLCCLLLYVLSEPPKSPNPWINGFVITVPWVKRMLLLYFFPRKRSRLHILVHWLLSKIEAITLGKIWITLNSLNLQNFETSRLLIHFSRSRNRPGGVRCPGNVPVFPAARVYHGADSLRLHV